LEVATKLESEDLPQRLKWSVRLLGDRTHFIPVIGLAAVSAGIAGVVVFRSPSMGLLGFAMILASTADYWLGSNYMVDAKGAQARVGISLTSMEWKDVKRVVLEPNAIKLSPLDHQSKMDAFRGVTLRTNPKIRAAALALIDRHTPASAIKETLTQESPIV
jgi:hypothetical protein